MSTFAGDLIRAIGRLKVTDAVTVAKIAELLGGIGVSDQEREPTSEATKKPWTFAETTTQAAGKSSGSVAGMEWWWRGDVIHWDPALQPSEEPEEKHVPETALQDFTVRPLQPRARATLPFTARSRQLESSLEVQVSIMVIPDPIPLIDERHLRAFLVAVLSSQTLSGHIDVDRLRRQIERGRPIVRIPRKPRCTLNGGVDVLMDMGEAMAAYRRDQRMLAAVIPRIVGQGRARLFYFRDDPACGIGRSPGSIRESLNAFGHQAAVLMIGSFGVFEDGSEYDPRRWAKVAEQLAKAGVRAIAFVPARRRAWPKSLTNSGLCLIPLDRVALREDGKWRAPRS